MDSPRCPVQPNPWWGRRAVFDERQGPARRLRAAVRSFSTHTLPEPASRSRLPPRFSATRPSFILHLPRFLKPQPG